MKHFILNTIALSAIYALLSSPAHAYIDPGTGALIIQALIGGVATALFTIKLWWAKLLNALNIKNDDTKINEQEE